MKKLFIAVILLSALFLLPGCDNNANSKVNTENSSEVEQINEEESASEDLTEKNASATLSENEMEISDELADSNEEASLETESEGENVEENKAPSYSELVIGEVAVGGTVFFGRYEQDNNLDNGPELVEWRVLSIEDGKATLVPAVAIMVGGLEDIHTLPQELYSDGFTDYEKELIVQFNDVIDSAFLSSYAGYIGSYEMGQQMYGQSSSFTFAYDQSESVKAHYGSEVFLAGVNPD